MTIEHSRSGIQDQITFVFVVHCREFNYLLAWSSNNAFCNERNTNIWRLSKKAVLCREHLENRFLFNKYRLSFDTYTWFLVEHLVESLSRIRKKNLWNITENYVGSKRHSVNHIMWGINLICFRLKLAIVSRELNSVSSDRGDRIMCYFVRLLYSIKWINPLENSVNLMHLSSINDERNGEIPFETKLWFERNGWTNTKKDIVMFL